MVVGFFWDCIFQEGFLGDIERFSILVVSTAINIGFLLLLLVLLLIFLQVRTGVLS
jgi:hypothetical protein